MSLYGIKYRRIFEPEKGYRNEIWPILTDSGHMINITFFKQENGIVDRIHRADAVSEYLDLQGLPTRRRFDNKILSLKSGNNEVKIGVYEYLPGETIPWEAYTMRHIKALGATMGNMHHLLAMMPQIVLPSVYSEYTTIVGRMQTYFGEDGVIKALNEKHGLKIDSEQFSRYVDLLNTYQNKPGKQPLHMDFVRGNILFDGYEVTGILDFEKTASGHAVIDIARTLAFLLVDCKYKSSDKVRKYFLASGYVKRGANNDIGDDNDREKFVEMFMMYDLYKFLLHNPYESLPENEHFVRTKDILLSSGVILLKQ